MASALVWLRSRDEDALVALLRARPDLALPAPASLRVLAGRLDSPLSVRRAMATLDRPAVAVLEALTLLDSRRAAAHLDTVREFLGAALPAGIVPALLDRLERLGLVRRDADGLIGLASGVAAALGEHPAGLGRPGSLPADQIPAALAGLDAAELDLLRRLTAGSPVGSITPGSATAQIADSLVANRLLTRLGPLTVELPREVGLALRGPAPLGTVAATPPETGRTEPAPGRVDSTGAGAALAALRTADRLLADVGANPPAALRSGGLGVRELRRLARDLDRTEHLTTMFLEVLAAAGLLTRTGARAVERWIPTQEVDHFLATADETRWATLAFAWLKLRRQPDAVGSRDPAVGLRNALSPELASSRAPADRRFVLDALASLPAGTGTGPAGLAELLAWRAPLRDPDRRQAILEATVSEATELGIVAFDSLTAAGRELLAGDRDGTAEALRHTLPPAVKSLMVQADLTVVAPGRLDKPLAARLAGAADVESAGSATVYRVSEESLRRAMDSGATSAELHELFGTHSVTGVPQGLTYLIDDVARRHGVLRIGVAGTYVLSEDPALVDTAVALDTSGRFGLRRLAPTVAVASAGAIDELMELLADGGLAPAAEDRTGAVVDLRPAPARTRAAPVAGGGWVEPPSPTAVQLQALVRRMRAADGQENGQPAVTSASPAELVAALRAAADTHGAVWIGYVESHGVRGGRLVEPVAIAGGTMIAFDRLQNAPRNFALHRITEVRPVRDERVPDGPG